MSIMDMTTHITGPQDKDLQGTGLLRDKGLQGWGALRVVDLLARGDPHARLQGQCRDADRIQLVARLLKEA